MDELHPYDGQERRFRDSDTSDELLARGRDLVTKLLKLPRPPPAGAIQYDLSFYSGGIGVFDRLFIRLACSFDEASSIIAALGFIDSLEAGGDLEWRDDFAWLIDGEVRAFLMESKAAFQPKPSADGRAYFERLSTVNSWAAVYFAEGTLNYLAFDQG